jgi:hypothetical protein
MDQERIKYFKTQYQDYTVEETEDLVARMAASPDSFMAEARTACNEVLQARGLTTNTVLMNRKKHLQNDQLIAHKIQDKAVTRSKGFTRILMKVQAYPALLLSLYLGWRAISEQDVDFRGLVVAIVIFGVSVWGAFFFQGDDSLTGFRNR